ncbi:DUF6634 family protein [uncultured Parvibaculum sp.]|mgnify:CR=1 FL=1|uniref:DUF6634 family protein n=1 Tax=uncultured Parvibaculum sp. TaxID=291828 RepID=UPI0030DA3509|tara:strand:+ start:65768 stop:66112 length:345 start_codon:yes stop_codon:yes gene_type:complete
MLIYVGRDGVQRPEHLNEELAWLKSLCIDLECLRAGVPPSSAKLDAAPFIDDYEFAQRGVTVLAGEVTGHPPFKTTRTITSDLCLFAPDLGWARTFSRYYRLGSPSHKIARWFT